MSTMTFEEMADGIAEQADEFISDVIAAGDRIVDMLRGAASSALEAAGDVVDFFTPDFVVDFDDVEKAIDKWNEEICPAIQRGIDEIATNLDTYLDRLVGDPIALIGYSSDLAGAGSELYQANTLDQRLVGLGGAWSGPAYDAYVVVAREQNAAYQALAQALEEGSTLTNNAAQRILTLWRQLLNEFQTAGVDALDILASATSVEAIVSFEVPVVISAIAKLLAKIISIADLLMEFMVTQVTSTANGWEKANNGSPGLPQNEWPHVLESSSDPVNDPSSWDVKV